MGTRNAEANLHNAPGIQILPYRGRASSALLVQESNLAVTPSSSNSKCGPIKIWSMDSKTNLLMHEYSPTDLNRPASKKGSLRVIYPGYTWFFSWRHLFGFCSILIFPLLFSSLSRNMAMGNRDIEVELGLFLYFYFYCKFQEYFRVL